MEELGGKTLWCIYSMKAKDNIMGVDNGAEAEEWPCFGQGLRNRCMKPDEFGSGAIVYRSHQ